MKDIVRIDLDMFREDTRENLLLFRDLINSLGITRPPIDQIHFFCPFTNPEPESKPNYYVGDGVTCFTPNSGHIDDPYVEHLWALRWGWVPRLDTYYVIDNHPFCEEDDNLFTEYTARYPDIYEISDGPGNIRSVLTLEKCKELSKVGKYNDKMRRDIPGRNENFSVASKTLCGHEIFYGKPIWWHPSEYDRDDKRCFDEKIPIIAYGKFIISFWIDVKTGIVTAYEYAYRDIASEEWYKTWEENYPEFYPDFDRKKWLFFCEHSFLPSSDESKHPVLGGTQFESSPQYYGYLKLMPAQKIPGLRQFSMFEDFVKLSEKNRDWMTKREIAFMEICTKGLFGMIS